MLITFLRRVELALLTAVEYPIRGINYVSSRAVRGLRNLQDALRRAI